VTDSGRRRPVDGKHALFTAASAPPPAETAPARGEGRKAVFSAPAREPGTVVVHCSSCDADTPVTLTALGRALVPSVWMPFRRFPHFMRCPACHHASWCRVGPRQRRSG
jgi:hypothetical protein